MGGLDALQLKKVMDQHQLTWRSFADQGNAGAGPIARQWNLKATPTFYVIDDQGMIRYKWTAAPDTEVLDAVLDKLLDKAEGKSK